MTYDLVPPLPPPRYCETPPPYCETPPLQISLINSTNQGYEGSMTSDNVTPHRGTMMGERSEQSNMRNIQRQNDGLLSTVTTSA